MSTTHPNAHEAVAAAREAREEAERALQVSRRRRADVAVHAEALRRARAIEDAAAALVAAVSGTNFAEKAVASVVVDLLGGSAAVPSVSRSRVEPGSVRRAPRAARRPGNRPLPA